MAAAGAAAALPAGVRLVDESALDAREPGAVQSARASLRDTGALLLSLSPALARQLGELLADSTGALDQAVAQGPQPPVKALAGDKLLLEYRLNEPLAKIEWRGERSVYGDTEPMRLRYGIEQGYCTLTGLGRLVLEVLSDAAEPLQRVLGASGEALDGLMEDYFSPAPDEVGASLLSLFRYAQGSGAAPHTDAGLLTLVFCAAPGLELHTAAGGWQPLAGGVTHVVVLAGELLQYCSSNAVPPALHRVVTGQPRHSVVLRLRAPPRTLLPRGLGVFGRFATAAAFERDFRDTHASVNALPCASPQYEDPTPPTALHAPLPDPVPRAAGGVSAAEMVLRSPILCARIADALHDDSGRGLARAELLCRAMRDAVAPRWHALCLRRMGRGRLPHDLDPAGDVARWRRLHRDFSRPISVGIASLEYRKDTFTVRNDLPLGRLYQAYCSKRRLPLRDMRFYYDGNQAGDTRLLLFDLKLHLPNYGFDAYPSQVGD